MGVSKESCILSLGTSEIIILSKITHDCRLEPISTHFLMTFLVFCNKKRMIFLASIACPISVRSRKSKFLWNTKASIFFFFFFFFTTGSRLSYSYYSGNYLVNYRTERYLVNYLKNYRTERLPLLLFTGNVDPAIKKMLIAWLLNSKPETISKRMFFHAMQLKSLTNNPLMVSYHDAMVLNRLISCNLIWIF